MLDQTLVKKARRALSRQLQLALETRVELIKKHVDEVSAALIEGSDEPEDLAGKFLDKGNPLWNAMALKVIHFPQQAMKMFDKAILVASASPEGKEEVFQVYFQEEEFFRGKTDFENGAVMPTEYFVGPAKEVFQALMVAGLNPVYRRKNSSVAFLEISW